MAATPKPRRTLASVALAVTLALAALLAACGRPSGVSVDAGADRSASDDRARAEKVVLSPGDVPGLELAAVATPDASSQQAAGGFQSCASAGTEFWGDATRTAVSPGFHKGRTVFVSSLAVVAATEADARRTMGEVTRPELAQCLTGLFEDVLGLDRIPGMTARSDSLPGAAKGAGADQSVAWRTTVQLNSAGTVVSSYSDITFVRSGRTVAVLFAYQLNEPFPAAERERLVAAVAARMD